VRQVRTVQVRVLQGRAVQVRVDQVRAAQVRVAQVRPDVRGLLPPLVPDLRPLLKPGNLFFVGHVTPLTAGMEFILAGARLPINTRLGSCPKTTPFSRATVPADGVLRCDTKRYSNDVI
jgi:hypothetical protein